MEVPKSACSVGAEEAEVVVEMALAWWEALHG